MIYISTCFSKKKNIFQILNIAYKNKISRLEITAGTNYDKNLIKNLKKIAIEKKIKLRFHNYFPPPKNHFFINLSSINKKIRNDSVNSIKKIINISDKFNSKKVGIHAGFLFDYDVKNKKIISNNLTNKNIALDLLIHSYNQLKTYADKKNIKLYLENNVIDKPLLKKFNNQIPLLLLDFNDYLNLKKKINFNLLFDTGHLKVSTKTLKINFKNEFIKFSKASDYYHISDNNGIKDSNEQINFNSQMFKLIRNIQDIHKKDLTIEVKSLKSALITYNNFNNVFR